jgi:cytochrome c-type biogenesis protein CcmE
MRKRSQRLWLIGAAALLLTGAVALAATALKGSVAFFYDPTDLVEKGVAKPGVNARVGGLVLAGSVKYPSSGTMEFDITDGKNSRHVTFAGLKPDMFAEGQGIVAVGKFDHSGELIADKLLAKHDENYMPKDVYDSLRKRAGEAGAVDYKAPKPGAGS